MSPQEPRRRVPRPSRPAPARERRPRRPPRAGAPAKAPARKVRLGSPRPRLRLISVGLTLVLLAFVVRLLQVQAVDAAAYAEKANVNRYQTVKVAAERGTVTDRKGRDLATTVDAYDITADPFYFLPEQAGVADAPAQAAALLAPVLGVDREELADRLADPPAPRYVQLARQRSPQAWRQIQDLKRALADKEAKGEGTNVLAGVYAEPRSKRVYPNRELAAGVLGFVKSDGTGGGGLEAQMEKQLAGRDGRITYAQSAGRRVPTAGSEEQAATPGTGLELTLDRDIQWAAQRAIGDQVAKSKADNGYVVVQDTRTGEILALANAPGYDPNDLTGVGAGSLGNPALQDAYEPGSTAKLVTMAAVLDQGVATPDTKVTVPNRLPRAGRAFADDHDHPTYHLTLTGVLAKSSNIGTMLAAERLGKTQGHSNRVLHRYLTDFGIGRPTGLGFPGETRGILAQPGDWNSAQQHTIPFGQGFSVNAVQAASVYSTIAGGGERVTPTLVRGTTGPDGRYAAAPEPARERVVSKETARTLTRMLQAVVDDEQGTGQKAQIPGYRVAGKTGTSNRVDPQTGRYKGYTASFAGFAPADKPRVTVYCAVQNPKRGSYFGSEVCGPVFKQVMKFSLKTLQAAPSGAKAPGLPTTFDPGD
ncbi:penicillin-binding protein 2 [Streptomyces sp. 549]|uniref:peptidoglycan D,D-transpeptidase FtsI family protein n=1 Tax=Streptomyces sp. 549 TaxID=3049076 RepID=UPI0024C2AB5D|nr:penicillin-binding protein 2 [Streptomyces sp. 549]MDK1475590.1 penicillin-binding protein 2 [Streptomyces sp. 549]